MRGMSDKSLPMFDGKYKDRICRLDRCDLKGNWIANGREKRVMMRLHILWEF